MSGGVGQAIARPFATRGLLRRLGAALWAQFLAERDRWPLFVPVLIGLGVGIYFALPFEPPLWPPLVLTAAGTVLAAFGLYRGTRAVPQFGAEFILVGVCLALIGAGMTAAKVRTLSVAAPVLEKRIGAVMVSGRVSSVEDLPDGRRIVFDHVTIGGLAAEKTPEYVRVNLRAHEPVLFTGQWVRVRASLGPPPGPAAPGAYDFQREAYFAGLGAVGFAMGRASIIPPDERATSDSRLTQAGLWLSQLRYDVTARVRDALGGDDGAVAAALMTGEQAAISNRIMNAMRNSGLAHLLAVSGFNFVLIAGMLFYLARAALALIPPIALRFPTKKWAAAVGLAGGAAYFAITGDSIATERAFIMVSIVFIAVLVDRTAISMRTLAWSATLILLLQPDSLLGASFQLSFAAVVALVAVYEGWGRTAFARFVAGDDAGPAARLWRYGLVYFGGIALTTVIASSATGPLLVYHFNRFAAYGLLANLVAVPLTAIWIMPWSLLAFVLLPLGLERFALVPMGWGVSALNWIAETASSWPGAVVAVPAAPAASIIVATLGGLWLCLWQRRWRLAGIPVIAAGLLLGLSLRPPDILVDEDAKLIGVRGADGAMLLSSLRSSRLHADSWVRRAGRSNSESWPKEGPSRDGRLECDALGCLYRARGQVAALDLTADSVAEDCGSTNLLVSLVPVRGRCSGLLKVIDRFDLWRHGSYAIWLDADGIRTLSVRDWQGHRPWVPARPMLRSNVETADSAE